MDDIKIPIADIFGPTLQGEGPDVGKRTMFIRVCGCSFNCSWCFGISLKNCRLPRVIKSTDEIKVIGSLYRNSRGTSITDVKIGDKILTYDDNYNMVETEVKKIIKRKAKCLKVKINNRTYLVTPEHPFFTERGLIPAGDLIKGDKIITINPYDITRLALSYKGEYNQQIQYNMKHMKELAEKLKPFYENLYNLHKLNPSINSAQRNGNYNENTIHTPHRDWLRSMINKGVFNTCTIDGTIPDKNTNLIIHHIDGDDTNDNFDNLIIISRHNHDIYHKRGFNYHKDIKDKVKYYVTVNNIEEYDKEVDVLNFSCEPYNTYLADGMWVHNCDSKFAWKRTENTKDYTQQELSEYMIKLCQDNNCNNIILTGGNPCLYNFNEFIDNCHNKDITIGVETQGDLLPEWLYKVDTLVFSPKAPSSKQKDTYDNIAKYIEEYKYNNQIIAIKIPVFNDEDIEFARRFSKFVNDYKMLYKNKRFNDLRFYLSVGNSDTDTVESIRDRVLSDYETLLNKINENPSDFQNAYILPQIHTLIWGNKQGV